MPPRCQEPSGLGDMFWKPLQTGIHTAFSGADEAGSEGGESCSVQLGPSLSRRGWYFGRAGTEDDRQANL